MSVLDTFSAALPARVGELREVRAWARSLALVSSGLVADSEFDVLDAGPAPLRRPTPGVPVLAVLAVHGYLAHKADLAPLASHLRQVGPAPVFTYSAPTAVADVPTLAGSLARHVDEVLACTGARQVHLVGHSLGGVLIRWAITYLGIGAKVASVTTLGSPFGGSPVANAAAPLLPAALAKVPNALRVGSHLLRSLEADSAQAARHGIDWLAVGSSLDHVVPGARAMLKAPALRATNVLFDDIGHLDLVFDARVLDTVAGHIAAVDCAAVDRTWLAAAS